MTKIIAHHKAAGTTFSNGFIISDSYSRDINTYKNLIKIARKDFPQLKLSDIDCIQIIKSSWCQGCTAIHFSLEVKDKHKDYIVYKNRNIDFNWS